MARPNVCVIECYFDGKPVLLIDNFEEIQEGEQLLLDYGERFWENKQDEDDRAKSTAHLVEKRISIANLTAENVQLLCSQMKLGQALVRKPGAFGVNSRPVPVHPLLPSKTPGHNTSPPIHAIVERLCDPPPHLLGWSSVGAGGSGLTLE